MYSLGLRTKLEEMHAILLMGAQSFRSDPPHPPSILFGDKQPVTALDSSSDAAARRSECDPGLTVVCEPPRTRAALC